MKLVVVTGCLGFSAQISMEEGIDEILEVLKVMNFDDHYHNAKYF
jgi:hypothetical protein